MSIIPCTLALQPPCPVWTLPPPPPLSRGELRLKVPDHTVFVLGVLRTHTDVRKVEAAQHAAHGVFVDGEPLLGDACASIWSMAPT